VAWVARLKDGGVDSLDDVQFRRAGVVVEFSAPAAAERTLERCLALGIPAVSATTGWEKRRAELAERFRERGGALVYGDNFSLGVHVFLRAAETAARGLGGRPEYDAYVQEAHHRGKADAPSGTARALVRRVLPHLPAKSRMELASEGRHPIPPEALSVAVTRAGSNPGSHVLAFDGPHDTLTLTHTARSNRGFAAGALAAAAWIAGRTGVWSATEMFDLMTREPPINQEGDAP
jgi:4-hydroxy-tetrahydrodipicolinate reductase